MPTPAGSTAGAAAASSSSRTGADEAPPRGRARALGPQEVAAKVAEYEAFANDVLKVRLDAITARRRKLQSEADEFGELARTVTSMHEKESTTELKALVELGAGVHCRARVPDAALVCVSVGLGFHLECTLPEAAIIASNRQRALQAKADECVAEAAQVKAHLRFVAQALGELQQLGR